MKKFTSILCALAIVLSASAAPVSKKDVLAKKEAKKEIRFQKAAQKAPAKAAEFKSFDQKTKVSSAALTPRFAEHKAAVKGVKVLKADVAKVQKAKEETINFTFSIAAGDEVEWDDYVTSEGWWQIQAENDEAYVTISNWQTDEVAGTYAWEDLDPDYCGFWLDGMEDLENFVDGSCTVTVDETDGLKVVVAGEFTDADGNTYNVSIEYEEVPIQPGDFDFVATTERHSFYASDNDVYFTFRDANGNVLRFDIIVAEGLEDVELGKTYTLDDMLANYSDVTYDGVNAAFVAAEFKKTIKEGAEVYTATATDTYGRVFHLTYSFKAPEKLNSETITGEVSVTEEPYLFWTCYTFIAQDERNTISLSIIPDETYFGTWEAGKEITGSVFYKATETTTAIYSGEVIIAPSAEGFTITGAVLCFNNTEYTLNLTYTKPSKTRDAALTLSGLEVNVFDGGWQISGFNEDETTYVTLAAYTDEVSGHYEENDLLPSYSFIYTDIVLDEEGYLESANEFKMLDADLDVLFNKADSTMIITGTFLGQNGEDIPEFTLNLSGKIPAPEVPDGSDEEHPYDEEVDLVHNFADYTIDDSDFAEWGSIYVEAEDEDGFYIILDITLPITATEPVAVPGTYVINETYYNETVHSGFYHASYGIIPSFVATLVEQDGKLYYDKIWWIVTGTVTISESSVIEVQALNSKGHKISCRLGGGVPTAIENTEVKAAATKRLVNGTLIIEKNGVRYNAQGAVVK